VIEELNDRLAADPVAGKTVLSEFARSLRALQVLDTAEYLAFREAFIQQDPSLGWIFDTGGLPVYNQLGQSPDGWYYPHMFGTWGSDAVKGSLTAGDGVINGLSGDDVIYGTARNELIYHSDGDALIVAGGGRDTIWAGAGNDILDGGEGSDTLRGETGNATYILRVGSGRDTIVETDRTAGNVDTIWIGSFLTPNDIAVKRSANDLVVKIIRTDDTMTVKQLFDQASVSFHSVEQIQFADGTVWDLDEILRREGQPTEGEDYLVGTAEDDTIDALGGNDTVIGQAGSDTLNGGAGNDILIGEAGSDTLNGGTGDDRLSGGPGSDRYMFAQGDGRDTVIDTDTTPGNVDTVIFTDILPSEVSIARSGNDLVMSVVGTTDSITLKDCFTGRDVHSPVERFQFAYGTAGNVDTVSGVCRHRTPFWHASRGRKSIPELPWHGARRSGICAARFLSRCRVGTGGPSRGAFRRSGARFHDLEPGGAVPTQPDGRSTLGQKFLEPISLVPFLSNRGSLGQVLLHAQ
ncbi:MAG: calcium-binding protein, partial [Thermodesulfobacteriota bacterium]